MRLEWHFAMLHQFRQFQQQSTGSSRTHLYDHPLESVVKAFPAELAILLYSVEH